jgi:DNA-binding transcriptional LysR family regulator
MAVRDAGSMTGASKRLRITQAAVSQQIRKLEAALGQRLPDRSNRDVVLTAPDLALRHSVRRIFDEFNSVEQSIKRLSGFTVARLSFGIMDALGDTLSPTIMSVLNPEVEQIEIRGAEWSITARACCPIGSIW